MSKIPYDLYIQLEELSTLFNESTSKEENILRCGLASIELSTKLLGSAIKQKNETDSEKISDIVKGIETQFQLLHFLSNPLLKMESGNNYYSKNIDNLKLLSQNYAGTIDRITTLYFEIEKKLNIKIGLEDQINKIRSNFHLLEIAVDITEILVHKKYVNHAEILKLNKATYFNSEDELFMTVHQISEYWFNIAINELKSIDTLFQKEETNLCQSKPHFLATNEILLFLSNHILLLEHMVLSDYHPLRVALRGASGGQSQQAHELVYIAKKVFSKFLFILQKKNKEIIQILEKPSLNDDLISVMNHFVKLERTLKNFFFQHYVLSASVIGSQSFGSLGYELVSLTDKFVEPIFKEIDEAKYHLTLKTNFQYGKSSGVIILGKENVYRKPEKIEMTHHTTIHRVIDSYFKAISDLDLKQWIELFSEDGYIEDPVGSRPYVGHKELSVFFKGILRTFSKLSMTIEKRKVKKYSVEVVWKAKAISFNKKELTFNGKELFQICRKGKIRVAQVYWEPSIIAGQL